MQKQLNYRTQPRQFINITADVNTAIRETQTNNGLCNVFLQHTSASLILCENADPDVLYDLEHYMQRLVQDAHPAFRHTAEGDDDMSAHIRSVLTCNSISIPISNGALNVGTWQGLFLWEHRTQSHQRHVLLTMTS